MQVVIMSNIVCVQRVVESRKYARMFSFLHHLFCYFASLFQLHAHTCAAYHIAYTNVLCPIC